MDTINSTEPTAAITSKPNLESMLASVVGKFQPYDAKLPLTSYPGYRAVKCLYKAASDGKPSKHQNSYIYIPDDITEQAVTARLSEFMPYFIGYLQSVQDAIVKDKHKAASTFIAESVTNLDAVLDKLEESTLGNKVNKEMLEAWFEESLADKLELAFAEKLGIDESSPEADLDKLATIINAYKQKLASLASPKVFFKPQEAEVLQRVLERFQVTDSTIGRRLHARLVKMQEVDTGLLDVLDM